jgi:hypothetical protein
VTVQDVDNPDGACWSDDYWKAYLDIMAHSRYNFLDIHGLCDVVTLTFLNGFSYFLSLPTFPEVGVGPLRAAKNLARFRQVIQMAADRGIRVGYMNYEAPPPIGTWKTRRVGVDERWVDVPQQFLEGPRLVQYTREAVLSFLKQLPGLWMFGFRVGESGQPEDFYQKTYLAALAELPPTQKVYHLADSGAWDASCLLPGISREREWIWHLIWGRTAYDPDVPDQVFVSEFVNHFGPPKLDRLCSKPCRKAARSFRSFTRTTTSAWTIRTMPPSSRMAITHSAPAFGSGREHAWPPMVAITTIFCE